MRRWAASMMIRYLDRLWTLSVSLGAGKQLYIDIIAALLADP